MAELLLVTLVGEVLGAEFGVMVSMVGVSARLFPTLIRVVNTTAKITG